MEMCYFYNMCGCSIAIFNYSNFSYTINNAHTDTNWTFIVIVIYVQDILALTFLNDRQKYLTNVCFWQILCLWIFSQQTLYEQIHRQQLLSQTFSNSAWRFWNLLQFSDGIEFALVWVNLSFFNIESLNVFKILNISNNFGLCDYKFSVKCEGLAPYIYI